MAYPAQPAQPRPPRADTDPATPRGEVTAPDPARLAAQLKHLRDIGARDVTESFTDGEEVTSIGATPRRRRAGRPSP